MKRIKLLQDICIVLALILVVQIVAISAKALGGLPLDDPDYVPQESAFQQPTAPTETLPPATETVVIETTVPETVPETIPASIPETEPVVEETQPAVAEAKAEKETIDTIPLYFQSDYPDVFYGSGTVADSGCGITALAMVATYLTDHVFLPDELADYFGGRAENNIKRMEYGAEAMKLPYVHGLNFHQTLEELKKGKVAIVLMGENSILSGSQHFVVFAGYNDDDKIVVLDPYQPNYAHWQLKRALVEGFRENDLSGGFEGSWIFDKDDMPKDPYIYQPELPAEVCRYPELMLSIDDIHLLAKMVWVEARGESFEGQQAVAEVVLNRLASGDFQDTLRGVIYAENQFRSVDKLEDADPYQTQYDAIEQAWHGPYVLPEDVYFFATYPVNNNIWGEIGGHVFCYGFDE